MPVPLPLPCTHYRNDGLSNQHLDGKSGSLFHQHQGVVVPIAMAVVVGGGQQLGLGGGAHHHEGEHRELQHTAHTVSDNVYQMVCNGQVQAHLTCRHSRESFTSLHFSLPPSLHFFPLFSLFLFLLFTSEFEFFFRVQVFSMRRRVGK